MADERNRWLDEAAADRLLRGDPVEPVGPGADSGARHDAARLRAALDALEALAEPAPLGAELPGEAVAVAAFRAAHGGTAPGTRPDAGSDVRPDVRPDARSAAAGSGDPLVDIGLLVPAPVPRRRRPVRFGLAAALASVAVGGLAAAAAAGLLDRSGHDHAGPGPALSVSADGDPASGGSTGPTLSPQLRPHPLRSGEGSAATSGVPQTPGADGQATGGTGTTGGPSSGTGTTGGLFKDGQDGTEDGSTGSGREGERENRLQAADLCQDYRAGHLDDDRRERLSRLARGLARIPHYCESVLDGVPESGPADSPAGSEGAPGGERSAGGGGEILQAPTPVTKDKDGSPGHRSRR
ncbi:hypothetical protein ABZX75_13710 [Streptomyces sp. NPDC003038]|uniref:hypothetical protein n=1 Tax=unclassified Streptomyces TaxID=2593676 RepID=UPI0033ACBDAA